MKLNTKKIDILLLRREMQNVALQINNYTQEEIVDLLYRAIELIDELRASKGTIEAIKCDLNEKILDEAKREIAEYESKERYSIIDRIKSLESQVYDF